MSPKSGHRFWGKDTHKKMSLSPAMKNAFKIFFNEESANPWLVLFFLVLASTLELISLGVLLPLLSFWSGQGVSSTSMLSNLVVSGFDYLQIPRQPVYFIALTTTGLALKFLLSFIALSYAGVVQARVATNFRKRAVKSLFNARWGFLLSQRSGNVANVVGYQAARASRAYMASADYLAALFQVSVYFIVGLLISIKLAIIAGLLGIFAKLLLNKLIVQARQAGQEQTNSTSLFVSQIGDLLANLKSIKSMDRQNNLVGFAHRQIDQLYRAMCRQSLAKYGMRRGGDIILIISLGIGLIIAVEYLKLELTEVVVLGLVVLRGADTFQQLQNHLVSLSDSESAYWNSRQLIAEFEANAESRTGQPFTSLAKGCRFDHVGFSHGNSKIVDDVSFDIPVGSLSVLIGPSGAGKTTLIDLLLGLYLPESGTIEIDGKPLTEISLPEWRKHVGYVPQELTLLHGTIGENITLSDDQFDDQDIWRALELADAADFVRKLENQLDTTVGEFGAKLSGGQRQRIGLARALISNPQLLILDEVTSALDPQTEQKICSNIASLKQDYTIVAVTHSPVWLSVADQTFAINNGLLTKKD